MQTGELRFSDDETRLIRRTYLNELGGLTPSNLWIDLEVTGHTRGAKYDLKKIFSETKPTDLFETPKSFKLIEYILQLSTNNDSIVLDSFAGSGTTAHAVLNLNKKDDGNRKFILIEMEDYAETITAERVRRVAKGYADVAGTGGEFDYYELGMPIFKEDKNLNEEVCEDKIREYIYYTETKQHLERERSGDNRYMLDNYNDTGYYFYYEKEQMTTFCLDTLNIITERAEQYVVYADKCLIDENDLAAKNIVFKKIPRDIKRF